VCERLGARAASHDAVLVALSPESDSTGLVEAIDLSDHPRVQRALRYRRDVRAYATADGRGIVVLGRGITGRWEIAFEVDETARGAGFGRALAAAGVALLPAGTPVWAQVAPGNAASLRAVVAAGFRPVGSEILLVRDPG
jgi:RimJ/RimL family protein N-acetyltransferase